MACRLGQTHLRELINRENTLVDRYHCLYVSKSVTTAVIMMIDLEESLHTLMIRKNRATHIINTLYIVHHKLTHWHPRTAITSVPRKSTPNR